MWGVVGDERVGFLMVRFYPDGTSAYLHDFFIMEQARRQGKGREMFAALQAYLKKQGITQIELGVLADNKAALAFWQSQGFELISHRLSRSL